MINESKWELALKNSWTKETSSNPKNWTLKNPVSGQCAVTSLIVNDYLGGKIVRTNIILSNGKEISHYFNKINNVEVDLTKQQFSKGTQISSGIPKKKNFFSTRDFLLSNSNTLKRYKLLKEKVTRNLIY